MQLLKKEQVNQKLKDQTRELVEKNQRLVSSLKKTIALQNDIDIDAEKAKKIKEYEVWCDDLQKKMSTELSHLKAYQKLVEDKKEEYYRLVTAKDAIEDKILTLKEEVSRLELQVKFYQSLIQKHA